MFEIIEHTADVGLRMEAPTLDQLLREAARALFTLLVPNGPAMASDEDESEQVKFFLPIAPPDDLLVDWLTELLFVFESRRLVLRDFDVKVGGHGLQATARRNARFGSTRGWVRDQGGDLPPAQSRTASRPVGRRSRFGRMNSQTRRNGPWPPNPTRVRWNG